MLYKAPKGTFDLLPYGAKEPWQLSFIWQKIERAAREICLIYGYQEIRTPIYESLELFDRGVGESSDIVSKEMFSFQDKGGRSLALRPEGTSAVMRAFIENQLFQEGPTHKLFYMGPMFRYERPQSGRYRQHQQFGVEAIGNKHPEQDVEVIDLLYQFYQKLGLRDLQVMLNTVGDLESRSSFKKAFQEFLKPHIGDLSEESQIRFEKNPLRILDSKSEKDRKILEHSPSILDFLTQGAKQHFDSVCRCLRALKIPFQVNDHIVRGLDYYNQTVFEIVSSDLKAQNTIGAGGRYDGLLKTLGGPDLPSVGFGTGLERVAQALLAQVGQTPPDGPSLYFIPLGEKAKEICFDLLTKCRHQGISSDMSWNAKKLQEALQNGVRLRADYCVIIGEEEIKEKKAQVKHLKTREQKMVDFEELFQLEYKSFVK